MYSSEPELKSSRLISPSFFSVYDISIDSCLLERTSQLKPLLNYFNTHYRYVVGRRCHCPFLSFFLLLLGPADEIATHSVFRTENHGDERFKGHHCRLINRTDCRAIAVRKEDWRANNADKGEPTSLEEVIVATVQSWPMTHSNSETDHGSMKSLD